jgi:hypothetical protein
LSSARQLLSIIGASGTASGSTVRLAFIDWTAREVAYFATFYNLRIAIKLKDELPAAKGST